MFANDLRSDEPIRHGAYLCLSTPHPEPGPLAGLLDRLHLRNELDPGPDHPALAIAFLRRLDVTTALDADDLDRTVASARAIIHVASPDPATITTFCTELGLSSAHVLRGVVRPPIYTGALLHNFAYAHRVLQQPASHSPHAFLLPTRKTPTWWAKDWMERHTYFLPRYDDHRLHTPNHVLAAAPGISCLMRRTYKHPTHPAPTTAYDFLNYFECSSASVPTFHAVCAALRDPATNPEWAFVHEGPTWHGRRVATWDELFD
ncbi:MAG: hypothetical protein ABIY55_20320 [Kofleriaceae bacterium]